MKTTTFLAIALASLSVVFTATATPQSPKSSATFGKALSDAEMIANLSPEWNVYRTIGTSMGDYFGPNSLIVVQTAAIQDVRVGMMIVYRTANGEFISHKVVAHNGTSLTTRGTSNSHIDPEPVTHDMIVGAIFCVFHTAGAPAGETLAGTDQPLPTALCKTF